MEIADYWENWDAFHILELDSLASEEQLLRKAKERSKFLHELFETEKNYCKKLNYVCDNFSAPLKVSATSSSPILTNEEIDSVFTPLEEIAAWSSRLVEKFQLLIAEEREDESALLSHIQISPLFQSTQTGKMYELYSLYCLNYFAAQSRLDEYKKRAPFRLFLKDLESRPGSEDLESTLIRPIQRISQINVLLKDILNATPQFHADYAGLKVSVGLLLDLCKQINDYVKAHTDTNENRKHALIFGPSLERFKQELGDFKHRRFIDRFNITEVVAEKQKSLLILEREKEVEYSGLLFLFNDVIIITHINPKHNADTLTIEKFTFLLNLEGVKLNVNLHVEDSVVTVMSGIAHSLVGDKKSCGSENWVLRFDDSETRTRFVKKFFRTVSELVVLSDHMKSNPDSEYYRTPSKRDLLLSPRAVLKENNTNDTNDSNPSSPKTLARLSAKRKSAGTKKQPNRAIASSNPNADTDELVNSLFRLILPTGEVTFIKYEPDECLEPKLRRCCALRNLSYEDWIFMDPFSKEILVTPELKLSEVANKEVYFRHPSHRGEILPTTLGAATAVTGQPVQKTSSGSTLARKSSGDKSGTTKIKAVENKLPASLSFLASSFTKDEQERDEREKIEREKSERERVLQFISSSPEPLTENAKLDRKSSEKKEKEISKKTRDDLDSLPKRGVEKRRGKLSDESPRGSPTISPTTSPRLYVAFTEDEKPPVSPAQLASFMSGASVVANSSGTPPHSNPGSYKSSRRTSGKDSGKNSLTSPRSLFHEFLSSGTSSSDDNKRQTSSLDSDLITSNKRDSLPSLSTSKDGVKNTGSIAATDSHPSLLASSPRKSIMGKRSLSVSHKYLHKEKDKDRDREKEPKERDREKERDKSDKERDKSDKERDKSDKESRREDRREREREKERDRSEPANSKSGVKQTDSGGNLLSALDEGPDFVRKKLFRSRTHDSETQRKNKVGDAPEVELPPKLSLQQDRTGLNNTVHNIATAMLLNPSYNTLTPTNTPRNNYSGDSTGSSSISPRASDSSLLTPRASDSSLITPKASDSSLISPKASDSSLISPKASDSSLLSPKASDPSLVSPKCSDPALIGTASDDGNERLMLPKSLGFNLDFNGLHNSRSTKKSRKGVSPRTFMPTIIVSDPANDPSSPSSQQQQPTDATKSSSTLSSSVTPPITPNSSSRIEAATNSVPTAAHARNQSPDPV